MLNNENMVDKGLEKAMQALEQARQRVVNERKRLSKQKLEAEKRHRYMTGGIVAKYLPDCYLFEETELERIISAALKTKECLLIIQGIKAGNNPNRLSTAAENEATEEYEDEQDEEE